MTSLVGESNNFFLRAMMGYRITKALLVANKLGIFDRLVERPKNATTLAAELKVDASKLDVLMTALAGMEIIVKGASGYGLAPLARTHLVSSAPGYVGNTLRFQEMLWENWSHLEDVLQSGKAWKSLGDLLSHQDQSFTDAFIRGMQGTSGPSSVDVARLLGDHPVKRIIDIGSGPGNFSRALLEANPGSIATLLDLPSALVITREFMQPYIDAGRCTLLPGNYLTDTYGSGFDLALLSHTTHDENDAGVASMLERAFDCLAEGGRVAIHDWTVGEDGKPLSSSLFSLNLSVYTPGRVYTLAEYAKLLAQAGFVDVRVHSVLDGKVENPTTLVVATKP